ncbi:MAG TPA: STN domain-containing protein [Chthoniobacteraceae bacterium]|nr:STN domain-containing protein [Chthoniobacteraceae bacterium]
MKHSLIALFIVGTAIPSLWAGDATAPPPSVKSGKASQGPAINALAEGDREFKLLHWDVAAGDYQYACDHLPESPANHELRAKALNDFAGASVRLAEQRIVEGRYADAKAALNAVLNPKYSPVCKPARALLAHLDDPGYFNPIPGPRTDTEVHEVKRLLIEAKGFYDTGRYDLAYKRYDQILDIDPHNTAALRGQEEVLAAKQKYARNDYSHTVSLTGQDSPGAEPGKYFGPPHPIENMALEAKERENVLNKLNRIIIPQVKTNDATLGNIIEYLHTRSIDLDTTETDPARKGVNIVLKLDPAPAVAPGMPTNSPGDKKITLSLTNIPLAEVLRYVCELSGLKYRVISNAVVLMPLTQAGGPYTQEYKLPDAMLADIKKSNSTPQKWLESAGVPFPDGTDAKYDEKTNTLAVHNTEANINLVDQIMDSYSGKASPDDAK